MIKKSKEELENQKLEFEIKELQTLFWKKPTFITVFAAIIIPLIVAIISFYSTRDKERDRRIDELDKLNNTFEINKLRAERDSTKAEIERLKNEKFEIIDSIETYKSYNKKLHAEVVDKRNELSKVNRLFFLKEKEIEDLIEESFFELFNSYVSSIGNQTFINSNDFVKSNNLLIENKNNPDNYKKYEKYILNLLQEEKDFIIKIRYLTILYLNINNIKLERKLSNLIIQESKNLDIDFFSEIKAVRDKQSVGVPEYYEIVFTIVKSQSNNQYLQETIELISSDRLAATIDEFDSKDNYFFLLENAALMLESINSEEYNSSITVLKNLAPFTFLSHLADTVINYETVYGQHTYNNVHTRLELQKFRKIFHAKYDAPKAIEDMNKWLFWKSKNLVEYNLWKGSKFDELYKRL